MTGQRPLGYPKAPSGMTSGRLRKITHPSLPIGHLTCKKKKPLRKITHPSLAMNLSRKTSRNQSWSLLQSRNPRGSC